MVELNHHVLVFKRPALDLLARPDSDISDESTVVQLAEKAVNSVGHLVVVRRHGTDPNRSVQLFFDEQVYILEVINKTALCFLR